jgi:hypothetical protein
MTNSKLKITGTLLLLLITPLILVAMPSIAQDQKPTAQSMITGILAHEMDESQAKIFAEKGFWIEADVEINKPDSSWTNIYNLSKQYNLSLIGKLDHITMNWKTSVPDLQAWNRTVQTAVNDYKDTVKAWEIWNEPIYPQFFAGNASDYLEILKAAYQTIKSNSPQATVIGLGGMHLYSHIDPFENDTYVMRGINFTKTLVSLGGMEYCDAISLHAYPWGNYSDAAAFSFVKTLGIYRNLTHKDIWITEVGQNSNSLDFTDLDQAYCLYNSYKLLERQNVTAYIWYELNDAQSRVNDKQTFGLFDLNAKPKMAFQTYTALKSQNNTVNQAVNYLVANYDPNVRLFRESPDGDFKNSCWVYSDNYLAQLALTPYQATNSTVAFALQNAAVSSLYWSQNKPELLSQYQILNNSTLPLPIPDHQDYVLGQLGSATIKSTINNQAQFLSSKNYADIAFLEAIAYHNCGKNETAFSAYRDGVASWDGVGFKEPSFDPSRGYDTYKLALYILASEVLNCTFDVRAYNNLLACQLSTGVAGFDDAGGFATYYAANGVTNNQTNTETTALAILALTYQPTITTESPPISPTPNASSPTPTPTPTPYPSPSATQTSTSQPSPSPTPSQTPNLSPSTTPTQTILADYMVSASAGPGGTINPSGDMFTTPGTTYYFTITPKIGYKIQEVTDNKVSKGSISTYNLTNIH